jgi:hypothetical protein
VTLRPGLGLGFGFGFGYGVWAFPNEALSISTEVINIARETTLLLDILTDLLVPVAITGDGPPLPQTPITRLDSAVAIELPAPNRSEALARRQSGRDYSQGRQTCLAVLNRAGLHREPNLEMACADSEF